MKSYQHSQDGTRIIAAPVTNYDAPHHFRVNVILLARNQARLSRSESDIIMNTPTWLSPALYGAGAGAIAMAIVGFTWGGWVTGATASKMADDASNMAVAASLTPYCLERARSDPRSIEVLAELKAANGFNRRGIVEKAGWATPLGSEQPARGLALACEQALASS